MTDAPHGLDTAPALLPTPTSLTRIGAPVARGWPATPVLARRALQMRSLDDPWRPSDVELDRIAAFLQRLGVARVELRQTSTPGVELVARGSWSQEQVAEALIGLVLPDVVQAWREALAHLPSSTLIRVVAAVDGRTDKTSLHLAAGLATSPDAPHTDAVRALALHLGVPDESLRWLTSVHHNLTQFTDEPVLAELAVIGDALRPWLGVRYPRRPVAAAQAVRASLGISPDEDVELQGLLAAGDPSRSLTIEARASQAGPPRLGIEG